LGFAEKRDDYWRGRYKLGPGKYGTVKDAEGRTIRFRTRREAEQAADEEEVKVRADTYRDPAAGRITFGEYVSRWYAAQDLAASTMQNYRHHIEEHLLPAFEHMPIADILPSDIAAWEKRERTANYAEESIKTWRSRLHLILADAVDEGLRESNPAARRRGRGRRAGRSSKRGPEKVVTSVLGTLLVAERAALLSGRDDEFVAVVLMGFTGMRWGELVGLETIFARPTAIRVEWQLYELDTGELIRCPPKDDSYRTIDTPNWLGQLVTEHVGRTQPKPCDCHGLVYVFRGYGPARTPERERGTRLVDVATRADVSTGTVSAVLNRPASVPDATRIKVEQAVADLGYVRGVPSGQLAAHWRRNNFAGRLFHPAAVGRYPARTEHGRRPVPVVADPWPGVPVRGRQAAERADTCWLPVAPGLTPHGLRHTHKTLMEELGTPAKLMDERMGHEDGSVQARYSHITPVMRQRLLDGLTEQWEAALDARRALAGHSPVLTLDRLLIARAREVGE
jgi:integrase